MGKLQAGDNKNMVLHDCIIKTKAISTHVLNQSNMPTRITAMVCSQRGYNKWTGHNQRSIAIKRKVENHHIRFVLCTHRYTINRTAFRTQHCPAASCKNHIINESTLQCLRHLMHDASTRRKTLVVQHAMHPVIFTQFRGKFQVENLLPGWPSPTDSEVKRNVSSSPFIALMWFSSAIGPGILFQFCDEKRENVSFHWKFNMSKRPIDLSEAIIRKISGHHRLSRDKYYARHWFA